MVDVILGPAFGSMSKFVIDNLGGGLVDKLALKSAPKIWGMAFANVA